MKNIQYLIALYYPYIPNISIIHEGFKKGTLHTNWSAILLRVFLKNPRYFKLPNIRVFVI